jgi:hypothetical protein
MKLIRPFLINDAALVSSTIGEGSGALALEGDMTTATTLELGRRRERLLLLEGDEAADDGAATLYALGDEVTVTATDYHHRSNRSRAARRTPHDDDRQPLRRHRSGARPAAGTPITFTTTGALPTGLAVGTIYYVLAPLTDSFNLAATVGGAAINTSGSQSGVHTAISNPNLNKNPRRHQRILARPGRDEPLGDVRSAQRQPIDGHRPDRGCDRDHGATGSNAVALINIDAAEVQIVSETDDGEVYNETFSLTSTDGITDWYAYFFEEIVRGSRSSSRPAALCRADDHDHPHRQWHGRARLADHRPAQGRSASPTTAPASASTDFSRKDRRLRQLHDRRARLQQHARRQGVVRHEPRRRDQARRSPAVPRHADRLDLGDGGFDSLRSSGFTRTSTRIHRAEQILLHLEIEGLT